MKNRLTPSAGKAFICLLLVCLFLVQACRKDANYLNEPLTNSEKQLIKQEAMLKWLADNPITQLLSLDWSKAKQGVVNGKNVVRVPTLNVDKTYLLKQDMGLKLNVQSGNGMGHGIKGKTSSTPSPTIGKNPNYYEKHPPEVFFIQENGSQKMNAYLLNFVPANTSAEFGEGGIWTGKLYHWNMQGDTVFVQDILKSKLRERYGLKQSDPNKKEELLKSKDKGKLLGVKDKEVSSFFGWLADLVGDVVGWIGHTLGFDATYYNSNNGYGGGWRIDWSSNNGGSTGENEFIAPTIDVYTSYLPGYNGGSGGSFDTYPGVSGPNQGYVTISGKALYLIQRLSIQEENEMSFLAENNFLCDELTGYMDTYGGDTDLNINFLKRAFTYLYYDRTKTFEDFKLQYIPQSTDVIFNGETGLSHTFGEITSFYESNSGLAQQILSGDPMIPNTLISKWGFEKATLIVEEMFVQMKMHPNRPHPLIMATATYYALRGEMHFVLDLAGLFPVYGEAFDILNGAIYFVEGDYVNAAFSAGSAIPIYGWVSTGGKWVRTIVKTATRPMTDAVGKVAYRAVKNYNGTVRFIKVAINSFSHNAIKVLNAVKPADNTLTNLSKNLIDQMSLRLAPTTQAIKTKIDDIVANGDPGGLTESISDDIFATNGFIKHEAHFGSNNGFDGVYIKKDASGNVEEIFINEAKQVGSAGNIKLNAGDNNTELPAQMSDDWIDDVLRRMKQQGGDLDALADVIQANKSKITKTVTGVDKSTKEIVVLRLMNY